MPPQCLQGVCQWLVGCVKESLEKSILMELIFSVVLGGRAGLIQLEVEINILVVSVIKKIIILYSFSFTIPICIPIQKESSTIPFYNLQAMKQHAYIRPFMESANNQPPSYPFSTNLQNVLIEEGPQAPNIIQCRKQSKKDIELQRRVNKSLQTFIDKYIDRNQRQMIADLKEKAIHLRRQYLWSKGVRQCTGLVVFMALKEQLVINLRQFCKMNRLSLKLTHKYFKAYYKLYHQIDTNFSDLSVANEPSASIKVEYKGQQDKICQIQDSIQYNHILQQEQPEYIRIDNDIISIMAKQEQQCYKAINLIFDPLFKGLYFLHNKKTLIDNLVAHIVPIDQMYKQIPVSKVSLFYYLIFAVIKHLGYRINFTQFSTIVRRKAGENMSKKQALEINRMYYISQADRSEADSYPEGFSGQRSQSQQSQLPNVGDVKQQQFNWQAGQFKMVESPMVMQQEYFSFENCYFFPPESNSFH